MPYKIVKDDPRCNEGEWALIKVDNNELVACHETLEKAVQQRIAIYASESE